MALLPKRGRTQKQFQHARERQDVTYALARFYARRGKLRNDMDQSITGREKDVVVTEMMITELTDEACSHWFEIPNARPYKPYDVLIQEAQEATYKLQEFAHGEGKEGSRR